MSYIPTERLIRSTRRTLDSLLQTRGDSYGLYNVLGVFMECKLSQYQMMLEKLLYSLLLLDASQKKHRSAHAKSSRRTPRGGRMTRRKGRAHKGGAPTNWASLFSWATTTQSITNNSTAPMLHLNFTMPYAQVGNWCSKGTDSLSSDSCKTIGKTFRDVDIKANADMAQFVMSLQQINHGDKLAANMMNLTADNDNSYLVLEWAPNETFSPVLKDNKIAKLAKLYSPDHAKPTDVVDDKYKAQLSGLVRNTGQGRYPLSSENPYEHVYANCTQNFVTLLFGGDNLTEDRQQQLGRETDYIRQGLFGLESKTTGFFLWQTKTETSNGKGWLTPTSLFLSMDIGYNDTDYLGPRRIVLSYRAFWQRAFAEHMHAVLLTEDRDHSSRSQLSKVLSNMQVSTFVNNHHNIELWRAMLPRLMQHPQIALETVLAMDLAANNNNSGEIDEQLQKVLNKLQENHAQCYSNAHGKLQPYCHKGYELEQTNYKLLLDVIYTFIQKPLGLTQNGLGLTQKVLGIPDYIAIYNSLKGYVKTLFYNTLFLIAELIFVGRLAKRIGGPITAGFGLIAVILRTVINYLFEMMTSFILTFFVLQLMIYALYATETDVEWKWPRSSSRSSSSKSKKHGRRDKEFTQRLRIIEALIPALHLEVPAVQPVALEMPPPNLGVPAVQPAALEMPRPANRLSMFPTKTTINEYMNTLEGSKTDKMKETIIHFLPLIPFEYEDFKIQSGKTEYELNAIQHVDKPATITAIYQRFTNNDFVRPPR